jgi:hypothetical protein
MLSRSLTDLVAAHLEGWELMSTDEAVFGTKDPAAIVSLLEGFCQDQLGWGINAGLFYGSSVGCVAGVELGDGRQVVVKVYQRRWGREFLATVGRVQRQLASRGFPCPKALLGGQPLGPALANVEMFLPDPGVRTLASSTDMAASAAGLAWQIRLCRHLSEPFLSNHPLNAAPGQLYPEPHSPFLDFSLRADDAAWIDRIGAQARAERDAKPWPFAIAHTDWSARNIRVQDGELVAAYDWDSLSVVAEPVAIGQAAATWCSLGEPGDPVAPSPEQTVAYISAYETAAGYRLTPEQHRAARAAALWVLCYTARCEHLLKPLPGGPATEPAPGSPWTVPAICECRRCHIGGPAPAELLASSECRDAYRGSPSTAQECAALATGTEFHSTERLFR